MKVTIDKTTGKMIEAQSHADDATLLGNAASYGYSDVEVREVSDDELKSLIEAKYPESYKERRAAEYPPMQDYVDAQVKKASSDPAIKQEGVQQETLYIAACAAIKAKYPKGTA